MLCYDRFYQKLKLSNVCYFAEKNKTPTAETSFMPSYKVWVDRVLRILNILESTKSVPPQTWIKEFWGPSNGMGDRCSLYSGAS